MTVHRLHAGDGYTYLTRQVATADHERSAGEKLSDYYTADGTPPGRWHGRGADALGMSGEVSETQMKALFGEGLHPDAEALIAGRIDAGATGEAAIRSTKLGRSYPVLKATEGPIGAGLRGRLTAFRVEHGRVTTPVERAILRTEAAAAAVTRATGQPATEREIAVALAADKRSVRHPVAGFDLVFTPQKSVNLLWGLGSDEVRRVVEKVHTEAVTETLEWVQAEAGRTRRGPAGVRQIDTEGLVVARFDHFDNRTGDPNLHTHAAVSNKVLGSDGRWSALDARVLYSVGVAASTRYNALVVDTLRRELGVAFEERSKGAGLGEGKAPVLEVVGVSNAMIADFSRRADIVARTEELATQYRDTHGHSPSKVASLRLAQQAVLDTRGAKGAPRSLAAMRQEWARRGTAYTGGQSPQRWVSQLLDTHRAQGPSERVFDAREQAHGVLGRVSRARSTWTEANLRSAAEDAVARFPFPTPADTRAAVEQVVAVARDEGSLRLSVDPDGPAPAGLARADGSSVYTVHGQARFTSERVLDAERDLLDAAHTPTTGFLTGAAADAAVAAVAADVGREMNDGQGQIARHLLCSGQLVAVAVGPAGAGKTTAMKAVVGAWTGDGRQVVALAPSAAAARVLGTDVGAPAQTVAKLLATERHRDQEGQESQIRTGAMLLVDEAGMTATADLAALVDLARDRDAVLRLVGDPHQLAAVESGGALRLLARDTAAPELTDVVRFTDAGEAEAGLAIRSGDEATAWDFYHQHGRVHAGAADELREHVLAAHTADTAAGRSSLMLAGTVADVTALNLAAHQGLVASGVIDPTGPRAALRDGLDAHAGDTVVTRQNSSSLRVQGGNRGGDPVTNGDLWRVRQVHRDGSLTLSGVAHRGTLVVPADYTRHHVELGYAATVHRAQGMTVDRAHLLTDDSLTRAGAYVGLTRGRHANHLYLTTEDTPGADTEAHHHPGGLVEDTAPTDPREVFARIVARADDNLAATEVLATELDHADDTTRLRAIHTDVVTTLAGDRVGYLLDRSLPAAQHTEITASERYRDLVATIAAADAHGLDTTALVTAITDPRTTDPDLVVDPLTGARDPAAVLRSRADRWIAAHTTDRESVSTGDTRPGGFRALLDLPARHQVRTTPARHSGMDTDLADHADRLAGRIHQLEAAGSGGADHAELVAELRADPMRQQSDPDLDRRLVIAREQRFTLTAVGVDNDTTRRLAGLIALGEAERARRATLTPEQARDEAETRRQLDPPASPQVPRGQVTVGVDEAEATRQRVERDQHLDRDYGLDV